MTPQLTDQDRLQRSDHHQQDDETHKEDINKMGTALPYWCNYDDGVLYHLHGYEAKQWAACEGPMVTESHHRLRLERTARGR